MAKSDRELEEAFLLAARKAARMPGVDNKKAVLKAWNKLSWASMKKYEDVKFEGKPKRR